MVLAFPWMIALRVPLSNVKRNSAQKAEDVHARFFYQNASKLQVVKREMVLVFPYMIALRVILSGVNLNTA